MDDRRVLYELRSILDSQRFLGESYAEALERVIAERDRLKRDLAREKSHARFALAEAHQVFLPEQH